MNEEVFELDKDSVVIILRLRVRKVRLKPVPCLRSNSLADPLGGEQQKPGMSLAPHTRFALGYAARPVQPGTPGYRGSS